jgi:predicted metal-dependent enzyme (double-stranded beta helix superfamily)
MKTERLPALQSFIDGMRATYRQPIAEPERWERCAILLRELLTDSELKRRSADWPAEDAGSNYFNLLFYEDPDHGFVVNGLIKSGGTTPVHDHAPAWTVYGVLRGSEEMLHYRRDDDGSRPGRAKLTETGRSLVAEGYVDIVRPEDIHAETACSGKTVAIIVRSRRVGSFPQNMYDPVAGTLERRPGPRQVPYEL